MRNPSRIKVAVIDNILLTRKAFVSLIESNRYFEVIAETENGKEIPNIFIEKQPDIILFVINEPYLEKLDLITQLNKRFANIKIIIMSFNLEMSVILEFISRGAKGFVDMDGELESLYRTLTEVQKDGVYFNKKISQAMLINMTARSQNPFHGSNSLTDREIAVLIEICDGHPNKTIAERLFISESTVNYHKGNIYRKIKSNRPIDAMKYAIKNRLIQLD